jgi:hypothetical protein
MRLPYRLDRSRLRFVRFRSAARVGSALVVALSCIVGLATTASATTPGPIAGYWSVDSTGRVFPDGDAGDLGDLRDVHLNAPIVGIASTPDGKGFWLAAGDGGVFTFGNAHFYGSAGAIHLNAPVVGIARTPSGKGYWLAAADGGVFTYGDAKFLGSAGSLQLHAPVVGIAATPISDQGYRLAAADGGIFTYGNAHFSGSAWGMSDSSPIVGIAAAGVDGYRVVAGNGRVFNFGGARDFGTDIGPISAIAATPFPGYVLQHSNQWWWHSAHGNASSCTHELPGMTQPRIVGIASAFDRTNPSVVEGALATVDCSFLGGQTGAFRAPGPWRISVGVDSQVSQCSVSVLPLDGGNGQLTNPHTFTRSGTIQMRSTQTGGHLVFRVAAAGFDCAVVATSSFFATQALPFTTTRGGATAVFSSADPITVKTEGGSCETEIHANGDGRLIQRMTGTSFTFTVPAGSYWLSDTEGCKVTVT